MSIPTFDLTRTVLNATDAARWAAERRNTAAGGATGAKPPAVRIEQKANDLKFALLNPDSDAAETFGVKDNKLTLSQIDDLNGRVARAANKDNGIMSSLSGIMDYIVAFFQALIGNFTGEAGFKDFSRLRGERRSLRNATKVYEALSKPDPDGTTPYAAFAEKISGVKPDGQGGYVPVLDEKGNTGGMYRREVDQTVNPREAYRAALEDRGLMRTSKQDERVKAIMAEEFDQLYKRDDIRAIVAEHRAKPGGVDIEKKTFVNDPRIAQGEVDRIVDRIINDEQVRTGGSFNYSENRAKLAAYVKWNLAEGHKVRSADVAATDIPPPPIQTAPELSASISNMGPAGGYKAVERAWYGQAFEALKPTGERPEPDAIQKARESAFALAQLAVSKYSDTQTTYGDAKVVFSKLRVEDQKAELQKSMNGIGTAEQRAKLSSVIDTMVAPTKDALEKTPPAALDTLKALRSRLGGLIPSTPSKPPAPSPTTSGPTP